MKDGKLLFLRKLQLETSTLPPERHFEVRDFFNEISRSEQVPWSCSDVKHPQVGPPPHRSVKVTSALPAWMLTNCLPFTA